MASSSPVEVKRLPIRIEPNPECEIVRFFQPGGKDRTRRTVERVRSIPERRVDQLLEQLRQDYAAQHPDIEQVWEEHFEKIREEIPGVAPLSPPQRLLAGACFTMEYALESAALFNPSMVPAPPAGNLPPGATRFAMSLRATGEGHISSIVFRVGLVDAENMVYLLPASSRRRRLKVIPDAEFETSVFRNTLKDLGAHNEVSESVMRNAGETFSRAELAREIDRVRATTEGSTAREDTFENLLTLARSHYRLLVPKDADPSEIVIFPTSESESRGIEDVRLVRFTDDDGAVVYYGTYTAYNGRAIFPTLLETRDFATIDIHPFRGRCATNKGMALFPRKIRGKYVMSGRLDGENLYILESDNVRVWDEGRLSMTPEYWWESVIIGNCGSPIETEEGWLLLTHGVGPMRQYSIGAALLDLDDPARVIGRLPEPLIAPQGEERVGYVPNVVYTCGAMLHNDTVVIPYAMSDMLTAFATVQLDALLDALKHS